jgi:trigger factor
MKVSSTEVPPRQLALDIEVEQERLDRAMDQAFRRLAGRVNVPGFRRGKAPRPMVERVIGRDRIVEDALDQLLPEVVNEAIAQEGVSAYARPRVDAIEFNPLRLKATVPLEPKVELGNYREALHVERAPSTVDDEQVESVVRRLREAHAQWVPVERPARVGDRVGLDLTGRVAEAERPFVDAHDAEYVVDPQGSAPAEGFADQLVGLSAGDQKTFTATLPADYSDAALAGRPAEFMVTLHWVKERELPELDDAFAQQVGEYADLDALRQAIRTELRTREDERLQQELETAAIDKLVDISTVEFPPQLVELQADHLYETLARNVEQQGLKLEQYLRLTGKNEAGLRAEVRAEAETRVRRSLALDAFASAEQIVADEGDGAARERKALGRLVELATGGGANGLGERAAATKNPDSPEPTPDTEGRPESVTAAPEAAVSQAEEHP